MTFFSSSVVVCLVMQSMRQVWSEVVEALVPVRVREEEGPLRNEDQREDRLGWRGVGKPA